MHAGNEEHEHIRSVGVRPGVSMLSVLPHLRYTHWHALGEFVDNAIQSYLEKADRIKEVDGPGKGLLVRIDTDPANEPLGLQRFHPIAMACQSLGWE